MTDLLKITDLDVEFPTRRGTVLAARRSQNASNPF